MSESRNVGNDGVANGKGLLAWQPINIIRRRGLRPSAWEGRMEDRELTRKDGADNAWAYLNRREEEDPLAPSKGIFWAIILSSVFWVSVIALIDCVK